MQNLREAALSCIDENTLKKEIMQIRDHPILAGQLSLFFISDLKAAEETFNLKDLPVIDTNNMYCITQGPGCFIDTIGHAACLINHSCDPTLYFDQKSLKFITTRDVSKGEMLSFDYTITELDISASFICCCGAANCKGKIGM